MAALVRGLVGFARAAQLLKVAVWWAFLPVFGFFCLLRWLLVPALLLAVFGLALGLRIRGSAEPGTLFHALPARIFGGVALLVHAIVIASALVLLLAPWDDGWTQVPGSGAWSDPVVAQRLGGGVVIVAGGPEKGSYWRDPGTDTYEPRGLPGLPGWSLADDPRRDWVWLAPRHGEVVTAFDLGGRRWLEIPAPMAMQGARGLVVVDDRVLLAGKSGLFATGDDDDAWVRLAVGDFTDLAIDPTGQRLLALGPRYLASDDRGRSWREVPRPDDVSLGAAAAIGGDGRTLVVDGGLVTGGVVWSAASPTAAWEPREAPGGDLRVIAIDPRSSDHLLLGTWGEGVFRSRDGGRSWRSLGLRGVSVRGLAVDFDGGLVHAASGNLLIRRGVFVRALE